MFQSLFKTKDPPLHSKNMEQASETNLGLSNPPQSPPKPQHQSQSALHQDDADEEDENVKQLRECSPHYLALQECIVNTNRNWKACQKEVQALKACNERRNNAS